MPCTTPNASIPITIKLGFLPYDCFVFRILTRDPGGLSFTVQCQSHSFIMWLRITHAQAAGAGCARIHEEPSEELASSSAVRC